MCSRCARAAKQTTDKLGARGGGTAAHCTPRHYQSLNDFSVRLREGAEPDRLWWRPAGKQGWASVSDLELPPGFKVPATRALPTVAQTEALARADILAEAARLRRSPRTAQDAGNRHAATDDGGTGPAGSTGRQGATDGLRQVQSLERPPQASSAVGGAGNPPRIIPGITPRARWFQPRAVVAQVAEDSSTQMSQAAAAGDVATHEDPGSDLQRGDPHSSQAPSSVLESLPETIARLRAEVERQAVAPSGAGTSKPAATAPKLGDDLPRESREALRHVRQVLAARFPDIYAAFAGFGPAADKEWKLSPSTFWRGLLAVGAEGDKLALVMEALAPKCRSGFLSLHDFVNIFYFDPAGGSAESGEGAARRGEAESAGEPSSGVDDEGAVAMTALIEEGGELLARLPSAAADEVSKIVAEAGRLGTPATEVARALHQQLVQQQPPPSQAQPQGQPAPDRDPAAKQRALELALSMPLPAAHKPAHGKARVYASAAFTWGTVSPSRDKVCSCTA